MSPVRELLPHAGAKIRVVGMATTSEAAPVRVPIVQTMRLPWPVTPPTPASAPVATARRIAEPASVLAPAVVAVGSTLRIAAPVSVLEPAGAPAATLWLPSSRPKRILTAAPAGNRGDREGSRPRPRPSRPSAG